MNKLEFINKISELYDNGYTFIAFDNGIDNTCKNKAIVSALRSVSLPVFYNQDAINSDKVSLAHTNIKVDLRQDNSTVIDNSLTIVNTPNSVLILTSDKDNGFIGLCQDYIDFTNRTNTALIPCGNWRQERGNSELVDKINKQNKG